LLVEVAFAAQAQLEFAVLLAGEDVVFDAKLGEGTLKHRVEPDVKVHLRASAFGGRRRDPELSAEWS